MDALGRRRLLHLDACVVVVGFDDQPDRVSTGYSSAKSIEIKVSAESASRLRDTLLRSDAQGQVVSILVDKENLAAWVL